MDLRLRASQHLKLSQNMVLTPQLVQAIRLLNMSRMELEDHVQNELLENPMLDNRAGDQPEGEARDGETPPASEADGPTDAEQKRERDNELMDRMIEYQEYSNTEYAPSDRVQNDELPPFESTMSADTSLQEHLTAQLSMSGLSDEDTEVAARIIGDIDDEGYFTGETLAELAAAFDIEEDEAEWILEQVQRFDPLGVAARNLSECLLLQAEELYPSNKSLAVVIENHIPDLERRDYNAITKGAGITTEELKGVLRIIERLEPKPGRQFAPRTSHHVIPDVHVEKVGDEYVVTLNDDGLPKLRINPAYRNLATEDGNPSGVKNYVQEKFRSALWLIKSIHQRQNTIRKVTEAIVDLQRDFFDFGVEHLKPMVLADIAREIQMHESTVSRVTTNKYVHTPQGIFELKYFFNSRINSSGGGDDLASEAVKQMIRKVIEEEPPNKPYSDNKLVKLLEERHSVQIARRTVAKYREAMHIPSSSKRKRLV